MMEIEPSITTYACFSVNFFSIADACDFLFERGEDHGSIPGKMRHSFVPYGEVCFLCKERKELHEESLDGDRREP